MNDTDPRNINESQNVTESMIVTNPTNLTEQINVTEIWTVLDTGNITEQMKTGVLTVTKPQKSPIH